MSKDRSDRVVAENRRAPRGEPSGHQDENVTGKPVKVDDNRPLRIDEQVRHIEFDAAYLTKDEGGRSTQFGRYPDSSVAAVKRGKSSDARGDHNIKRPVHPQGKKKK